MWVYFRSKLFCAVSSNAVLSIYGYLFITWVWNLSTMSNIAFITILLNTILLFSPMTDNSLGTPPLLVAAWSSKIEKYLFPCIWMGGAAHTWWYTGRRDQSAVPLVPSTCLFPFKRRRQSPGSVSEEETAKFRSLVVYFQRGTRYPSDSISSLVL